MGDEILGARIKHRRGVIDRRIDEAVIGGRVAAGGDDAGVGGVARVPLLSLLVIHGRRFMPRHAGRARRMRRYIIAPLPRHRPLLVNPLTLLCDRSQMPAGSGTVELAGDSALARVLILKGLIMKRVATALAIATVLAFGDAGGMRRRRSRRSRTAAS